VEVNKTPREEDCFDNRKKKKTDEVGKKMKGEKGLLGEIGIEIPETDKREGKKREGAQSGKEKKWKQSVGLWVRNKNGEKHVSCMVLQHRPTAWDGSVVQIVA